MNFKTKLFWLCAFAVMAMVSQTTFAGTGCLGTGTSCSTPTTVNVTILPGDICIGSSGTFDFGQYTVSSTLQTVNWAFVGTGGYFWVDDLKWADSGYYTTVQMSGDLVGPGTAFIPAVNVKMSTASVGSAGITLLAGTANSLVQVNAGMASYQSLDVARRLIERNTAANFWVIGKYGVLPLMQLDIPAYQSVGTYTGTLVYTLYSN